MNVKVIFMLVGMLLAMLGVIMIYDARLLTKKLFGFGDQNEATMGFKILGSIISFTGGMIILFQ